MKSTLMFLAASWCLAASPSVFAAENRPSSGLTGFHAGLAALQEDAASADARYAQRWVASTSDNQNLPFVIVDKKAARLFVFEGDGRLVRSTPVLLGAGVGDESVPGIENRDISSLRVDERTTPAGRFVSEPGRNLKGEDIVWVDYGAKVAIHRLRPDAAFQQRAKRLASGEQDDKRVSLGCIVVPVAFYEDVIRPLLGKRRGLVYVLPESRPVQQMFGAYELSLHQP